MLHPVMVLSQELTAEKTLTELDDPPLCCRCCRRGSGLSDSFGPGVICWAKADTPKRKKIVETRVIGGILLRKRKKLHQLSGAKTAKW